MSAKTPVFTIIGGDKRLYYLAQELLAAGSVICCGTSETPNGAECEEHFQTAVQSGDILIFPVPFTKDGKTIPAAFPISIEEAVQAVRARHLHLFGGKLPEAVKARCQELAVPCSDWMELESVSLPNAILTAEGVILEALQRTSSGLYQTKAAVLGYGRCGKAAASRLKGLCRQVTAFARNPLQRAEAEIQCIPAECLESLPEQLEQYDLLINTIPSMALTGEIVSRLSEEAVILDLASGRLEEHISAEVLHAAGERAVLCPGLPGKYFPREAGRILARTVIERMKAVT